MNALDAVLDEIEEYLENRADVVDGSYGEPRPNKEMSLLTELRASREAGSKTVNSSSTSAESQIGDDRPHDILEKG